MQQENRGSVDAADAWTGVQGAGRAEGRPEAKPLREAPGARDRAEVFRLLDQLAPPDAKGALPVMVSALLDVLWSGGEKHTGKWRTQGPDVHLDHAAQHIQDHDDGLELDEDGLSNLAHGFTRVGLAIVKRSET